MKGPFKLPKTPQQPQAPKLPKSALPEQRAIGMPFKNPTPKPAAAVPPKPNAFAHRERGNVGTSMERYAEKQVNRKLNAQNKEPDPNKLVAPVRPKIPAPPRYDATKINFGEEDEWMKSILTDTWAKLPPEWQRDIGRYPYQALKAWLFFYNQGPAGVLFDDQFLPGHLAAQQIQRKVESEFSNQANYSSRAQESYQNQLDYYNSQKKQEQEARVGPKANPLPFRRRLRYA